jgi:hypothetical protein
VTTTSTSLVPRRDYLVAQRRTIIARSVLAGIAGAVPVPFLDDWAVGAILGAGYRRVANAHGVDLDADAVRSLVFGTTPPPSVSDIATMGVAYRIAGKAARRMLFALATLRRARSAARTFVVMTLFDHYCARLHRGLALDGTTALALRDEIGRAIDNTPGALAFHPFRRGALAAARATLRAPLELANLASRGALRRMLARRSEGAIDDAEHFDALEQAMEQALADKHGFLARTVAAVELQLSAEVNPFLDATIESLDKRWRARVTAAEDLKK